MYAIAKRLSMAALAAGAGLVLSGCVSPISDRGPQGTPTVEAPSQPAPGEVDVSGPVLIGLMVPLSAGQEDAAQLAEAMVNSARLALADAGAAGLRLEVYDTGGTPAEAQGAARQAVFEGAKLLVGPLFAQTTTAIAPIAREAGINVISFSTDSAVAGDPVYLSGYLPEAEARRIAAFASRRDFRRIALYYPETAYGEAARRGLRQAAARTGMEIVAEQSYPRSFEGIKNTAGAFADRARAAGAQAVLLADGGQGLRSVGAFMSYRGVSSSAIQYLGLGQWNSPVTLEEISLKGGVFPAPDPERVRAFLSRYAAQFGERPPVLAVLAYDGVALAAQMVEDARGRSAGAFSDRQITRPGGWSGVFGPVRFLDDATAERGMAILIVTDNGFEVLEPAPPSYGAGL